MAAVYRARHLQLGSDHAVKVLFVTAADLRMRLFKEGQVQAKLRHPNIVQVTDVLQIQGGVPALVMEYVDGPSLDAWLLENRPTMDEALWVFRGILRGVAAAHDGEVVHRDLKPANVLLAPTFEGLVPKVTDFGLVKSVGERGGTMSGMAMGTPEYMAPEQVKDASDVDQRADLWALGCILYELVCHRRAFTAPDKISIFNAVVAGQYEPPRRYVDDLPRNVAEAIRMMLQVDPEQRVASCREAYDLLYEQDPSPRVGRLHVPMKPSQRLLAESPASEITIPPDDSGALLSPQSVAANAPTGAPAARRMVGPSPMRAGGPARIVTQDSEPRLRRVTWLLPLLLVVVGTTGIAITALLVGRGGDDDVVPPPVPAPAVPEPEPVVPVSPDPVPEPVPEPEPGPESVRPTPSPGRPRPQPTPTPAPTPSPTSGPLASFSVEGPTTAVWLVDAEKHQFSAGQTVSAGQYSILADFGNGPVVAGDLHLASGERAVVKCDAVFRICRQRR